MPTYGDRLKQAREAAGRTQQEVAQLSGLSLATVQRAESNKHQPTLLTLAALAEAAGTTLGFIIAGETSGTAA